jgi:hypothetical protein
VGAPAARPREIDCDRGDDRDRFGHRASESEHERGAALERLSERKCAREQGARVDERVPLSLSGAWGVGGTGGCWGGSASEGASSSTYFMPSRGWRRVSTYSSRSPPPLSTPGPKTQPPPACTPPTTRGLHSSTFQLNSSALYGVGGACSGCVARVKGVLGGIECDPLSDMAQVELRSGRVYAPADNTTTISTCTIPTEVTVAG